MDGPRACRPEEFDEVIELINQTFRIGSDQNIRTDYPLVFDRDRLEYMRIIRTEGKVVAHVPVAPRQVVAGDDTFTVGIISPTITHPDYRRRGYATLCLRDCVRIMEERDWPVAALWTQEATFPFYHHSGWEAVGVQGWAYRLDAEDRHLFARGSFEVAVCGPENSDHLDGIIRIHDAEPFRIARTPIEYQALFSLPKITTFVALEKGEVQAYLMAGSGTNKPGLIEGGGNAAALESLVAHVLAGMERGQIQVILPSTPTQLGGLVQARKPTSRAPVEGAAGVGPQMMRVNSLDLLRRIEGYLTERSVGLHGRVSLVCSDTEESITLEFADGRVGFSTEPGVAPVVLSRRQLAQLIFGGHAALSPLVLPEEQGELLAQVFPYYFPIWELDHS